MMNLKNMTPEQKANNLAKARETRKVRGEQRRRSKLRKDFLDAPVWLELARKHEVRLPPWGEPCTVASMRTQVHRLGVSQRDWEVMNGCKMKEWIENNPEWPLRAFVGLILEEK